MGGAGWGEAGWGELGVAGGWDGVEWSRQGGVVGVRWGGASSVGWGEAGTGQGGVENIFLSNIFR